MSFVPRVVTHNASLKLLAFLGAVVLWAIVPGSPQGGEVLTDVPVRVQVADLDWVPAGSPDPARVQVRLSGPTREIIRLAREGASIRVPLDRVDSPDTSVVLRRDWVILASAPGVVVEEIVPGSIRLRFEAARSQSLPLVVRTTGSLPPGMALAAPLGVTPVLARVRGPARIVDGLVSIEVGPLDLGGLGGSGIVELPVDTAGLGGVLITPQRVSVGVRVEPAAELELGRLPVVVTPDPGWEVEVEPATASLSLLGAAPKLAATDAGVLRILADGAALQGMVPGESRRVPIRVTGLPDLVRGVTTPDSVMVRRPPDAPEEPGS